MLIGWDRGHFFLIKRALLVIKRAWLIDADWLSTPALNWFPASNGVWKGISETHALLSLISTRSFHLIIRERKSTRSKALSFGGKAKRFFRPKTYWFAAWKQFEWGRLAHGVERSTRQNFVASKLKGNFFVLLRTSRLISITCLGHLIGVKKQRKFCRYAPCSQWKREFWIQEVIRARLDTCLRLSTIDEVVLRRCKLRNCKTGE